MLFFEGRELRIEIFRDTMRMCEEEPKLREAVKASISGQKVILQDAEIPEPTAVLGKPAQVLVSKKRSLEAAAAYRDKRVCVLNFASATNPGGGVTKGSSAQEECLCRCSTLYPCISDKKTTSAFHAYHRYMLKNETLNALYNDDCIYTPDVIVFKSDDASPKALPKGEWYPVDIITCAAPNLRKSPSNAMNPDGGEKQVLINPEDLKALHFRRADRIMFLAASKKAEVLILGAFGCGAFKNPPETVAAGILEAVKKNRELFQTIEFAVYCPPGDSSNYNAFKRVFENL